MRVNNQKILKMMSTANLSINSSGHAVVPFRIEEVSSNHQRQKFKIRVGPDTNKFPLHGDIASSFSSPVTVRSKKPKSKRVNRQDRNSNKRARLSPPGVIPQIGLSMQHALESSRSNRIPPIRPHQAIEDLITWATRCCWFIRIRPAKRNRGFPVFPFFAQIFSNRFNFENASWFIRIRPAKRNRVFPCFA